MTTKNINRISSSVFAVFALILFAATIGTAAPGDLDTTFGDGGKSITSFGVCDQLGLASVVQSDGKIISGGQACTGDYTDMYIARFNADGTPDVAFATNGRVNIDFDGFNDSVAALAVQIDGKIVAVGSSYSPVTFQQVVTLVRLNTDGSLDTTFDGDGKRILADKRYASSVSDNG